MPDAGAKRAALLITTLSSFLTPFMGSAVTVALKAIGEEFGLSAVALSWVMAAYLLPTGICVLPFGRLADIHGRKRFLVLGLSIFTAASVCLALAPTMKLLLAARAAQGVGSAMIFCTGVAILLSVYGPEERGRVLGINTAAVYLGLSVGPVLGGFLVQYLGWRSIFVFSAALGTFALAAAARKLKGDWVEARGESFDLAGALLYGLALLSLAVSLSWLPEMSGLLLLALGVLALGGFVAWERRVRKPLFDVLLFRDNAVFAFSNLAALINYAATFAVGFLLSLYLQHVKALDARTTGFVLLTQPVLMALMSPFAGRLSDRIQPRIVASSGMAIISAGLFMLSSLSAATPLPYIITAQALLGLGFAFFSSPNTNAVMSSVGRPLYAVAAAILSTMRLTGHVLSISLVTLILSLHMGRAEMRPELHSQFVAALNLAFPLLAAVCLLGVLASLARGNVRQRAAASD